ncbi:MAG TPA: ribonuclease H [Candidatus Paceibacterota bacterium]
MNKLDILIFCDGASKGNPGPGGWGALVATAAHIKELGARAEHTTNNKMELTAALEALTYAHQFSAQAITVHADSSYVINGITKWVAGWKRNGWQTKEKKEVLNKELWVALDVAVQKINAPITWKYVGGHVGIAGNERVDAIASDFAEGKKPDLYKGPRAGYALDITNLGHDVTLHKDKSASRVRSKAKAYSYVSKVDGKIIVHKTWSECEERVRGKTARYKKSLSAEDEANLIKEFSAK